LLSGLKLQVQLAVGEIADLIIVLRSIIESVGIVLLGRMGGREGLTPLLEHLFTLISMNYFSFQLR